DGVGQVETAAAVGEWRTIRPGQNFQKPARHGWAFVTCLAADEHGWIMRFEGIFQDHGTGRRSRMRQFEPGDRYLVLSILTLEPLQGFSIFGAARLAELLFD